MATVMLESQGVTIPGNIIDLDSFTRWTESSEFPETGRYNFIHNAVWVDSEMEQLLIHNRIKIRITTALDTLVVALAMGYVFGDRARLRNEDTGLSVEPDIVFASFDAVKSGRASLSEGAEEGYVRLDGTPDLVVEVVSASSETKDTVELKDAYFEAGIPEYWIVDARRSEVKFELLRRGNRGYSMARRQPGGWVKSGIFGLFFRISENEDKLGNRQFTLEHRV